jgi:small subunit ribosomal protein S1
MNGERPIMSNQNLSDLETPFPSVPEASLPALPVDSGTSDPVPAHVAATAAPPPDEAAGSFATLLSEFEREHSVSATGGGQREGTVVAVTAESAFVDIGYKTEGVLSLEALGTDAASLKVGDRLLVSVKGRNEEGYYELTRQKVVQPKDWSAFESAFAEKATIAGTVTALVKGGFTVDVGVRAFMPASRSGVRDAAQMEKLVGQEIHCRIIKLEVESEDIVVDRRVVTEAEEHASRERRYDEIKEGDTLTGTVRTLTDYGAFVDLGSVDALLHIGDISWARVEKVANALSVGESVQVKVLSIDPEKRRISVGMKQLLPHPWDAVADHYKQGERVSGTVTRLADFGAFVQLEPGVEGMVHLSEMSWAKKVRKPGDMVKVGDPVDAVILAISVPERRISLGLKQTLGDPFVEMTQKYPVGSAVEGKVTSFTKFGAFVQLTEGVEGMVHVSEIVADKRIDHPQDVLRAGQVVKAQVIDIDREKRQFRLSMKRLIPTSFDEYLAEHHAGDIVTARIVDISNGIAKVELGEGIHATCQVPISASPATDNAEPAPGPAKVDLSSFSSMLKAKWAGPAAKNDGKKDAELPSTAETPAAPGQIRSFRLTRLDPDSKQIEVELC